MNNKNDMTGKELKDDEYLIGLRNDIDEFRKKKKKS